MAEQVTVRAEEVLPVRSRISWGAIFAGVVVALSIYFVLTLLGAAIGLSVSGRVRPESISGGAALWSIGSVLVALFCGGCTASQCSVGENKNEAILYGAVVWGMVFGAMLLMTTSALGSGFSAIMSVANVSNEATRTMSPDDFAATARRAGLSQAEIDSARAKLTDTTSAARTAAENPQNQQAATDTAAKVAWWAFLGTLLSMIAAVVGAYVGAGPKFHEIRLNLPRVGVVRRGPVAR